MRKSTFKTQGIVLKRLNFNEADKLLSFYTRDYGKLTALAKGVRRIKSRKAAHLEIFNQVDIFVASGKTFHIVIEAQTVNSFACLRSQLSRVIQAYRIVEVVDRFCPENQENKRLYNLLIEGLAHLSNCQIDKLETVVDDFTNCLLYELGFLTLDSKLKGRALGKYIEEILEAKLKVNKLLTKLR